MTESDVVLLDLTPPDLRAEVESRLRRVKAAKGRTVLGVGTRTDEVFFVIDGEAGVALHSPEGKEVSVRSLGPGDLFGDLAAIDGLPRSASVVALTPLRLVAMSRSDFLACLASSPEASNWFARRLVREVRRLTDKVFELSALTVRARLLCELLRMARAAQPKKGGGFTIRPAPTHYEFSKRIGSQREAISREMSRLEDRGILRRRRRSLEFADLRLLEAEVERAVGVPIEADSGPQVNGSATW